MSAHLVDLVVLAGIMPFENSISCSLLANSKRCRELLEGSVSCFEQEKSEGNDSFVEGCGWLDGCSFVASAWLAQSVHSHFPRQNGEKEQTGLASSTVSLMHNEGKQSIYGDLSNQVCERVCVLW